MTIKNFETVITELRLNKLTNCFSCYFVYFFRCKETRKLNVRVGRIHVCFKLKTKPCLAV